MVGIWWNGLRKLLKYEDFQEPHKIFQWFLCFGPRILVSYWAWTFPVTTDTNIFCHWNIFYIPGATNDMIDRCLQPNEISSNKIRLQIWSLFNLKKFVLKLKIRISDENMTGKPSRKSVNHRVWGLRGRTAAAPSSQVMTPAGLWSLTEIHWVLSRDRYNQI